MIYKEIKIKTDKIQVLSVSSVRNYIKNQEAHHAHKTWEEEYNEFVEKYGFEKFKNSSLENDGNSWIGLGFRPFIMNWIGL